MDYRVIVAGDYPPGEQGVRAVQSDPLAHLDVGYGCDAGFDPAG